MGESFYPIADPRHSRESTKRHLKSGVITCNFSRLFRIKMPTTDDEFIIPEYFYCVTLSRLEYDRTKGFSSSAGAELFKTHVRLTEAEAELLKLKFG